jgi:hypothetical protein
MQEQLPRALPGARAEEQKPARARRHPRDAHAALKHESAKPANYAYFDWVNRHGNTALGCTSCPVGLGAHVWDEGADGGPCLHGA